MRRLAAGLFVAALVVFPVAAVADHKTLHAAPQGAAKVRFGPGFPNLVDHEWKFAIGGFGGVKKLGVRTHVPVVFVHGNTSDHADWYPVRNHFKAAGWTDQELWALSYNGLGGNGGGGPNPERDSEHVELGSDLRGRTTNNETNVPDLSDFIRAVRTYTGSPKYSIVAHSLGVTVARRTLKVHPELRADLVAFVGIAGGNHGTSLCPPGSESLLFSCEEVAAGTDWLEALNGPGGSDETYPPAKWLTIYDGSGALDAAYVGPEYAESPRLEGADNRTFATHHNDLRLNAAIVAEYRAFLEGAEKPYLAAAAKPKPATVLGARRNSPLAATGVGAPIAVAAGALGAAGLLGAYLFGTRRRLP